MDLYKRFFDPPAQSFFLFGPRGTGKSTWVRETLGDSLRLDLLDPETCRQYQARPERLLEVVRANPGRRTIVIDEVQKVPEMLPAVHLLIEEDRSRRFVLTGSSARKLRRSGVNLLAGRALVQTMHPFVAAELGPRFRLEEALVNGLLPLVVASRDPRRTLRSYAATYLREEVQAEGLVRRLAVFARFLEAVSFSHAAVLNLANVARDCQTGRKTVEGHVEVLEDLLLSFRIPVFTRRAGRALAAHPKFYLFDAGVYRSLRPSGPLDRPSEIDGAALEGLVAQHLRAWSALSGDRAELFYWRTRSGNEVDFVVYGPNDFTAIEVKNSSDVRPEDLRGLKAFHEDYPEAGLLLAYRGKERRKIGDVTCVPCEEFLFELRPGGELEGGGESR
jgi:predicted AAA+ superfamily ATPase